MLTTDTQAAAIPTIIANKALGKFAAYMNLARTVTRDFELTDADEGQTINVTKRGTVTANEKAQTADVIVQNPALTSVPVTLNKHFEVTFRMSDVLKAVKARGVDAGLEGYADDAALALAEKVESTLVALYASLTATPIAWDKTSLATKKAKLMAIRTYFVNQRVPLTLQKYLYADGNLAGDILSEDAFTGYQQTGNGEQFETGQLTRPLYGIKPFESQLVPVTGVGPFVHHGLAYTKGAFVLASRPLPAPAAGLGAVSSVVQNNDIGMGLRVVRSYNSDKLAEQMTLDVLIGAAVVDQRQAVEVQNTVA